MDQPTPPPMGVLPDTGSLFGWDYVHLKGEQFKFTCPTTSRKFTGTLVEFAKVAHNLSDAGKIAR